MTLVFTAAMFQFARRRSYVPWSKICARRLDRGSNER